MASILDRYGIKEVCDFTFYKIDESTGKPTIPVLYLDTLKVSTVEQTAENTSARGGKGNPEIINWDYGKEINITLEDAVFSAKSLAIMFGSVDKDGDAVIDEAVSEKILKTAPKSKITSYTSSSFTFEERGESITVDSDVKFYDAKGEVVTISDDNTGDFAYATGSKSATTKYTINITSDTFPGMYYCIGETFCRSEVNGEDEAFQLVIPKAKVQSENTLTMEAEGDPSTFSMNLKVLRPADGKMMKLIKYAF